MIKTTIKEITEKFDKNGILIERLTREEFIEDDESCGVVSTTPVITPATPYTPATPIKPWYAEPYCNNNTSGINDIANLTGKVSTCVTKVEHLNNFNDRLCAKDCLETYVSGTECSFAQAVNKCINS